MNISYFRKSDKSVKEVAEGLKENLSAKGAVIVGESALPEDAGTVIHFTNPAWTAKIVAIDHTVAGLIPTAAFVTRKDGKTLVGTLNPQLLGGSQHLAEIAPTIDDMNRDLRATINAAAGVGDQKPRTVTLYSTTTCPYCRMEKDYLEKNKVQFKQVLVDTDRKAAEEMVQKTGQMGVPVTEVQFDDGDEEFIVGFDKGRLNELLGIGVVRN